MALIFLATRHIFTFYRIPPTFYLLLYSFFLIFCLFFVNFGWYHGKCYSYCYFRPNHPQGSSRKLVNREMRTGLGRLMWTGQSWQGWSGTPEDSPVLFRSRAQWPGTGPVSGPEVGPAIYKDKILSTKNR